MRKEVERLSSGEARRRFPDAGGVDSNMYMSQKIVPGKVVFRSGWAPGDMHMLVEAYVRHNPLNPIAILSFERHGSAFAETTNEKFVSRENAVRIDDVDTQTRLQFVQLLLPHDPGEDARELAGSIEILRDEPGLGGASLTQGSRSELAILNLEGAYLELPEGGAVVHTDARAAYAGIQDGVGGRKAVVGGVLELVDRTDVAGPEYASEP